MFQKISMNHNYNAKFPLQHSSKQTLSSKFLSIFKLHLFPEGKVIGNICCNIWKRNFTAILKMQLVWPQLCDSQLNQYSILRVVKGKIFPTGRFCKASRFHGNYLEKKRLSLLHPQTYRDSIHVQFVCLLDDHVQCCLQN